MSLLDDYTKMIQNDALKKAKEKFRLRPEFYIELLCFIGAFGMFFDRLAICFLLYPMLTAYLDYKSKSKPTQDNTIQVTNLNEEEETITTK